MTNSTKPRPRDHEGKFIPLACPLANCDGHLVYDEHWNRWECDGLVDPENTEQPLEACWYSHHDHDVYEWWMWDENGKSRS